MSRALILVENTSVPSDPRVWPECKSLAANGWEVQVVCPSGVGRDTERHVERDGISIDRYPLAVSGGGALGYAREYAIALARTTLLASRVRREQPFDVVQACNPPDFLLLAALRDRLGGAALILDHHDLSPELYEARYGRRDAMHRALRAAEALGFRLADVVISPNESFRDIATTRGRKRPEDVFVVRNGPDPGIFRPVPPDQASRGRAPHVLGFVGAMGRQDGVDVAIESLGLLAATRRDWHALFVGDGEALPAARAQASRLGIETLLSFTGYVGETDRLVQLLSTCDVCLSPEPRNTLNESSTLIKVAEYMAVGCPVVAFDLRETRRTAANAASYARADSTSAFAAAISELLDDPERRLAMGEIGRRRVTETLSWAHSEPMLLQAYERASQLNRDRSARRIRP